MRLDYKIIAVESTKNDLMLLSLRKTFEERRGQILTFTAITVIIVHLYPSDACLLFTTNSHLGALSVSSELIYADVLPFLLLDFYNETYS